MKNTNTHKHTTINNKTRDKRKKNRKDSCSFSLFTFLAWKCFGDRLHALHCNALQLGTAWRADVLYMCVCVCDRCADLYVDRGKLIVVNVMWYGLRPLHCWNVLCALTIRLFTPYTLLVFRFLSISIVDYIVRNVLLISFNKKTHSLYMPYMKTEDAWATLCVRWNNAYIRRRSRMWTNLTNLVNVFPFSRAHSHKSHTFPRVFALLVVSRPDFTIRALINCIYVAHHVCATSIRCNVAEKKFLVAMLKCCMLLYMP